MRPSEVIRERWKYLQEPELEALHEVILSLPDGSVCVNIGAGFGTSGLAFIESENVKRLYTVDLYQNVSENGLGSLDFEKTVFAEFGFDNDIRYIQIRGDAAEVGQTWYFGLVDMVFIDADHSYEHCKADIEAWLPNIKLGGIIAFHDYGNEDGLAGVTNSVDELLTGKCEKITSAKAFIAFRKGLCGHE